MEENLRDLLSIFRTSLTAFRIPLVALNPPHQAR